MSDPVPTVAAGATVAGPGAIEQLSGIVQDMGAQRALLVCGRTSFEASGASRILPHLERAVSVRRWDGHRPNPTAVDVAAGLRSAARHRPDVIIGVGGGSSLDIAKIIAALIAVAGGDDVAEVERRIQGKRPIVARQIGLILAPTTSGSGAQATHFATVYVGATKHSVAGPALVPDRVILDPELAMSGSSYQRAVSGIDALAQAIESMWAVDGDRHSRDHAHAAIRLLLPSIVAFAQEPGMATAHAMSTGSQLAGEAINRSRTTLPHALSYSLTQRVGLPHGHAVAHTLPAIFERHIDARPTQLVGVTPTEHAHNMGRLFDALEVTDGDEGIVRIEAIVRRLGLRDPDRSRTTAIRADIDTLSRSIDPIRASNNPVRFSQTDVRAVLLSSLDEAEPSGKGEPRGNRDAMGG